MKKNIYSHIVWKNRKTGASFYISADFDFRRERNPVKEGELTFLQTWKIARNEEEKNL